MNLTDGECFNADLGLGPNSDGSEDYVIIQMANSAGSTNFQIADSGADARTVSYVVNGVTINSGNPNYTTNCSAGCSASGTHGGTPFSFTYTDTGLSGDTGATVGPPSAFSSPSGGGQSATISTAFASVLTATVVDAGSNPVSGVSVTFTAPGSGASGTFSGGGASETVTTDGSGVATSTTFTANTVAGGYNVVASSAGISNQSFALTNTAGAATTLAVSSGDSQSTAISTSFGTALVALVTDAGGNPVSGVTVNFSAPGSGASASLSAGSAVSDVSGLASVTATANAVAGGYNVTASATGLTPVTFGLTNLDVVAPTVMLSTSAVSVRPGEDFDVTATFSEAVTGFALLDVLVTHGSAVALSGGGSVYVITIRPTGGGDIGVSIAAGVAQDSSGNGNLASGAIAVQNSAVQETSQLMLVKSEDDGLSWSKSINITSQVKDPKWHLLLQGPGKGITMSDGTLVFPAQYKDEAEMPHSTIIYSKDRGKTWEIGTGAKPNTTVSQVVELDDGRLMLNMRDNRGGSRSVYTTSDMGQTWEVHSTSRKTLIEPVCM
ncbi:exo-alpha-sialidase, partial [Pseudophaeobacter arcticus]|uniref:exo-alpha-sialidase n=1 Tax=Pseudophaeobacter arcticus TaxID=385492 RepID=UPI00248F6F1D